MKPAAFLLIGLIIGAVAGFAASIAIDFAKNTDFQKNLEKATKEINRQISIYYPDVTAKVREYKKADFYLVKFDFTSKDGLLTTEEYLISADGKLLISKRYATELQFERLKVSEDDDPWIGSKDAKIVIVEFSDYTCPYCALFALEVERKLLEEFNSIKIVFRDFPVHGGISIKAAEAANCAGEQQKYWDYHYLLFEKQSEWINNESKFYEYAENLGLDFEKFKQCLDSGKYEEEINKDAADGRNYGVTGTPTFFINGYRVSGYVDYEALKRIIENELEDVQKL